MSLFLSLFLLVLAFFILLVVISTLEDVKTRSVMDSLSSTFTTIVPPSTDPTEFKSKDGQVLAAQRFQQEMTELFATALQVVETKIVTPGKLMQVQLSAKELFHDGETRLRTLQAGFFDRLVAALSGRPAGLRFDMEFVIASQPDEANQIRTEQTLEMARAGAFAREMNARGLPQDSISIGLTAGNPDDVTLWFYIRTEEEARLPIGPSAEELSGAGGQPGRNLSGTGIDVQTETSQ